MLLTIKPCSHHVLSLGFAYTLEMRPLLIPNMPFFAAVWNTVLDCAIQYNGIQQKIYIYLVVYVF